LALRVTRVARIGVGGRDASRREVLVPYYYVQSQMLFLAESPEHAAEQALRFERAPFRYMRDCDHQFQRYLVTELLAGPGSPTIGEPREVEVDALIQVPPGRSEGNMSEGLQVLYDESLALKAVREARRVEGPRP